MASLDEPERNAEFSRSLGGNFPVVSDPDGSSARAFGVVGLTGLFAKRWTFYIDAEGVVRHVDRKVNPETAGEDMVRRLEALGFPKREADASP